MMTRGWRILLIYLGLSVVFMTGCTKAGSSPGAIIQKPVLGVVVGAYDDTWRTAVRNELYTLSEQGNMEVDILNANSSQDTENEKIDILLGRKVSILAVNLVDVKSAASTIEKAKAADTPVVFFNTAPASEDLAKWDKAYYVGAIGEKSGSLQGQILVEYFTKHPTKDGIIRYYMLKGPADHPDSITRSMYSVKTMEDAGLKLQKAGEDIASWDRSKAEEDMDTFLSSKGDSIDCVIANNDDMALGAVDALKNKGYFKGNKYIPIVGVDATSKALSAVKEGSLLGTVLNDAQNQGKAIFNISVILARGEKPSDSNCGYKITDNREVFIDYKTITEANLNEAGK